MKRKLAIFLTGGLGNQLFQLAAGIHLANGRAIELDLVTARPRRNSAGEAEILSLNLPENIELRRINRGRLIRRIYGFNLRSGYSPNKHERTRLFKVSRKILSTIALSISLRRFIKTSVAENLGSDSKILPTKSNEVVVGYFQTHQVARELLKFRDYLFSGLDEERFIRYKFEAVDEQPLLVHIRLGDYLNEDAFGTLSSTYYENAITFLWQSGSYKKIWLFSDQPEDAVKRIPVRFRELIRVIPTEGMESAETLRIMTLCNGFIIANSTFSWWAAYLREHSGAPVVAPKPWFKQLTEPDGLIPDGWQRISGFNS